MPKPEKQADLATKGADASREAREQAEAHGSIFASTFLTLDDGTKVTIPPHPTLRLLDDDVLADLDRLDFELESYDRHPDVFVPESKVTDSNGDTITLPSDTKQGALKYPYRKTGPDGIAVLLDPPYDVQQVKMALGEVEYAKLRAGTINGVKGSLVHVKAAWREQGEAQGRRQADDPKSAGSTVDLAPVPEADSERPVEVPPPSDS